MPIDEYTFPHFVPRLGFLLHDMDMDKGGCGKVFTLYFLLKVCFSEKLSSGAQKFILKKSTEGSNQPRPPKTPYLHIQARVVFFNVEREKWEQLLRRCGVWLSGIWSFCLFHLTFVVHCQVEFKVDGEWMMEEDGMEEVKHKYAISLICVAFVKTTHTNLIRPHCCLPIHILELPFYLDWSPNWSEGNPVGCTSDPDYNLRCSWTLRCWMTLPLTRPCSGRKSLTP